MPWLPCFFPSDNGRCCNCSAKVWGRHLESVALFKEFSHHHTQAPQKREKSLKPLLVQDKQQKQTTSLRPTREQHRRCHPPSKKSIYHPGRERGKLENQQQHPMRREPSCFESTSFPEGKPTCLTSSPSKQGVVLGSSSSMWEETGLLWSVLGRKISQMSSKWCFPAQVLAEQ